MDGFLHFPLPFLKRFLDSLAPLRCRDRGDRGDRPGFLLSCITAVLEFTNPTELEHKKRMAEIKVGPVWSCG